MALSDLSLKSLQYRALKLRHDWWYRWAHDPLCDRLGSGVLTIGKLRLCRSCLAMYSGAAAGAATAVAIPAVGTFTPAPALWLGAMSTLGVTSVPSTYAALPRPTKDLVRTSTGFGLGLLLAFPLARRWAATATLSVIAGGAYRFLIAKRAKGKAQACDGCPELGGPDVCSGYAQQAVSLRAYERDASALATRARMRQMA